MHGGKIFHGNDWWSSDQLLSVVFSYCRYFQTRTVLEELMLLIHPKLLLMAASLTQIVAHLDQIQLMHLTLEPFLTEWVSFALARQWSMSAMSVFFINVLFFVITGFDDQEIVALSGAHALGRCHTTASGYDGPWTPLPTKFSNLYFTLLNQVKWNKRDWSGPFQYEDEGKSLMMLPTDLVLIQDSGFKKYVDIYAGDQEKFFSDFSLAFNKLEELGTKNLSTAKWYWDLFTKKGIQWRKWQCSHYEKVRLHQNKLDHLWYYYPVRIQSMIDWMSRCFVHYSRPVEINKTVRIKTREGVFETTFQDKAKNIQVMTHIGSKWIWIIVKFVARATDYRKEKRTIRLICILVF